MPAGSIARVVRRGLYQLGEHMTDAEQDIDDVLVRFPRRRPSGATCPYVRVACVRRAGASEPPESTFDTPATLGGEEPPPKLSLLHPHSRLAAAVGDGEALRNV